MEKKQSLLASKLLYTCLMVLVYLIGKNIPLYMIDIEAYANSGVDAEALLVQTISGDINRSSLFALGISPYMISSIVISIVFAFKSKEAKKRTSPLRRNKMILNGALFLAFIMAIVQVQSLHFRVEEDMLVWVKAVVVTEMIAGAFFIIYLMSRIKKYGVGGQSALILMNIIDGIFIVMQGQEMKNLAVPVVLSVVVIIIMLIMENTEKRIPVQRISIHNVYADRNYLAIKMNPIGVMPAMFATAFFLLPQLAVTMLEWFLPENANVIWLKEHMTLSEYFGIAVYAVILFVLTIGFSRVMINPKDLTENFLKSGDSIRDLHAGRDTQKYLSRTVNRISFFSAMIMCVCLCTPLLLQVSGNFENALTTLPSSAMMLTGIWCNLYREVEAVRDLDSYKPFI